jgi:hypothetical protein
MQKTLIAAGLLLLTCVVATAQTRDPRVDELTKETEQLKRRIADQDGRIAELEKTVKSLRATAVPLPTSIPAETPPWHRASNWTLIKTGMSEAQVVGILGAATNVDSSMDRRTLDYTPNSNSTSTLKGNVTLVDDRVTAMTPPVF